MFHLEPAAQKQLSNFGSGVFSIVAPSWPEGQRIRAINVSTVEQVHHVAQASAVRGCEDQPAVRSQHAMDFCQHGNWICRQVFQHFAAKHSGEAFVSKWQVLTFHVVQLARKFMRFPRAGKRMILRNCRSPPAKKSMWAREY